MATMRFAAIQDITLHYVCQGQDGGIPLVFINALGADLRIWGAVTDELADRYTVIRYDKRGHGLSDCPPGPYSIQNHTTDLIGLLDHLRITEVILVGISVGGLIALDFAIHQPQRVQALILSNTGAKIGTAAYWQERITAIRSNGIEPLAEAILSRWFAPPFSETYPAAYHGYYNMLTRTPIEGYAATCEAIRDADSRASVGSIQVPTLVLCGSEDLATTPDLGRKLAASMPNAQFALIEGAAHLPCIEQPEQMTARIDKFLSNQ